MVTFINGGRINYYYGLSTDDKPMDAPNASFFYEMDTGDAYMFDRQNVKWLAQGGDA